MKQVLRFFTEAMGSGATPAQIHNNISKALKSAGFKVKKFQKMSSGHGGVWGGFYTVSDGMVLPFHVKKDGKVSYDAGPKDWIIGNIDYVDVMTRILKRVKKMPGYGQDIISNQANESVNEAIKPQGYSQLNTMVKHATIYLRDLSKALKKQDDDAVLREVHFLAAQFTTMEKMLKDKKWNAKYNESITINGKKYKPLNENDQSWAKYYSWRNDKSMTPKQKIGMSMREVRDSLQELEKIVFRSIKLKKELKVGSDNYWKSTHSALRRIHERLVKLTGKIANLY